MRRVSLIIFVLAVLVAGFVMRSKVVLHLAKARAEKECASERAVLNTVPLPPSKRLPIADYTNTIWIRVAGVRLGFPEDRFTRDPNPKRENAHLYHSSYHLLVNASADTKMFDPVMQPLGETNLYHFFRTAFNATALDIQKQRSMEALERHLLLLKAKSVIAPASFSDSCVEFDRGDLKGFIVGDTKRNKNLGIRVYLDHQKQFVDLGVIAKTPLQMSNMEELISVLKVEDK